MLGTSMRAPHPTKVALPHAGCAAILESTSKRFGFRVTCMGRALPITRRQRGAFEPEWTLVQYREPGSE